MKPKAEGILLTQDYETGYDQPLFSFGKRSVNHNTISEEMVPRVSHQNTNDEQRPLYIFEQKVADQFDMICDGTSSETPQTEIKPLYSFGPKKVNDKNRVNGDSGADLFHNRNEQSQPLYIFDYYGAQVVERFNPIHKVLESEWSQSKNNQPLCSFGLESVKHSSTRVKENLPQSSNEETHPLYTFGPKSSEQRNMHQLNTIQEGRENDISRTRFNQFCSVFSLRPRTAEFYPKFQKMMPQIPPENHKQPHHICTSGPEEGDNSNAKFCCNAWKYNLYLLKGSKP